MRRKDYPIIEPQTGVRFGYTGDATYIHSIGISGIRK